MYLKHLNLILVGLALILMKLKKKYKFEKYILLFPFCSPHLTIKKWPYYNELIKLIKDKYDLKLLLHQDHQK